MLNSLVKMSREPIISTEREIKVSFGYKCNEQEDSEPEDISANIETLPQFSLRRASSSFSCLSGAALSANPTLANTNMCNGVLGAEILPGWDSPSSFRRVPSSPSLSSKVDLLSSSFRSTLLSHSNSSSTLYGLTQDDSSGLDNFSSSPLLCDSFLNAAEVQVAGGAAGEDRVQAVCSEEDGWLFCGIYDGFNGRDAADFLTGTLYDTILMNLNRDLRHNDAVRIPDSRAAFDGSVQYNFKNGNFTQARVHSFTGDSRKYEVSNHSCNDGSVGSVGKSDNSSDTIRNQVVNSLIESLNQAENDYLCMVEKEMDDRPDLVSVGSCVLVALLLGNDLYTVSLGDSRAVLATYDGEVDRNGHLALKAIQLTEVHTTDNELEISRILLEHPDDPAPITNGRVKGKLKVTRALGVGYLKKGKMNDALMGILRVPNLISPPYVSTNPSIQVHTVSDNDDFVILGSDGLFDFFTNEEAVKLVHSYASGNPFGDPAKFLLQQLVVRAAERAGFTMKELMEIPPPRRRKYHDDVTVVVVMLGTNQQRTSRASTNL